MAEKNTVEKKPARSKTGAKRSARSALKRKTAPKDAVPKKAAPKKPSAKRAAPKKTALKKTAVKKKTRLAPARTERVKPEKTVKVTLVKSVIGTRASHRATVRGLGLRRIRHTVELEDTPSVRGMINKVSYLVRVEA